MLAIDLVHTPSRQHSSSVFFIFFPSPLHGRGASSCANLEVGKKKWATVLRNVHAGRSLRHLSPLLGTSSRRARPTCHAGEGEPGGNSIRDPPQAVANLKRQWQQHPPPAPSALAGHSLLPVWAAVLQAIGCGRSTVRLPGSRLLLHEPLRRRPATGKTCSLHAGFL